MKDSDFDKEDKDIGLKGWIINTYTYLIEHNICNTFLYCVLMVAETMQLLFFPLVFPYGSKSPSYLGTLMEIFNCIPYIIQSSNTVVYYIWLVGFPLQMLAVVFFIATIIKFRKAHLRPSFIWRFQLRFLSLFLIVYKTVLLIPSVYLFSLPVFCTKGFPCWTNGNFVVSSLSVMSLVIAFLFIGAEEQYGDYYIYSNLPWAKPSTGAKLHLQLLKYCLTIYIAIDYNYTTSRYAYPVAVCFFIFLAYSQYYGLNFYNGLINSVETIRNGLILSTSIALYFTVIFSTPIDLGVEILVIICGLGLGLILFLKKWDNVESTFKIDFTRSGNENMTTNVVASLIKYPSMLQKDPELLWPLIGVWNIHKENCKNKECVCHIMGETLKKIENSPQSSKEKISYENDSPREKETPKRKMEGLGSLNGFVRKTTQLEQWQTLVGILLDASVEKFPKSVPLRLLVSYYQESVEKNYYKAFFQLVKAFAKDCSFGEQLAIHRMKVLLDQTILQGDTEKTGREIDLDLNTFVNFEKKRRELESCLHNCTQKVMQFWGLLLSANVKIDKIYMLGGEISTEMEKYKHNI